MADEWQDKWLAWARDWLSDDDRSAWPSQWAKANAWAAAGVTVTTGFSKLPPTAAKVAAWAAEAASVTGLVEEEEVARMTAEAGKVAAHCPLKVQFNVQAIAQEVLADQQDVDVQINACEGDHGSRGR